MSIAEIEAYFDTALTGLVHGVVTLAGRQYHYRQWQGERLASRLLSVDTETAVIQATEIPRLAVATAFDGQVCYLVHPDDIGRFILERRSCNWVGHNLGGFDFHVIQHHLKASGQERAARAWLRLADRGRMACTMLLDQLVRLANGATNTRQRDLAAVARDWTEIPDLDKDDPWRIRYGEISVPTGSRSIPMPGSMPAKMRLPPGRLSWASGRR